VVRRRDRYWRRRTSSDHPALITLRFPDCLSEIVGAVGTWRTRVYGLNALCLELFLYYLKKRGFVRLRLRDGYQAQLQLARFCENGTQRSLSDDGAKRWSVR
jgi:hypothetical protein